MKKRTVTITLVLTMILNLMAYFPINAAVSKIGAFSDEAFDYALFTNNQNAVLEMNANNLNITGGVHSNSKFLYHGNTIKVSGVCEAYNDIFISVSDPNYRQKIGNIKNDTENVALIDYSSQIYDFITEKQIPTYSGNTGFSSQYVNISENIYVGGTLGIFSSKFVGSGIIYAKNGINYSVSDVSSADGGTVILCAENGDININASNTTFTGIIYAPNGTVTITGQNVVINGRIIADKFNFWGSNLTINSGESDLDLIDFLFYPEIKIITSGEYKENRKITLDISNNEKIEKFKQEEAVWEFLRADGSEAVYGVDYAIDEENSDGFTKNLIFRKTGVYSATVTLPAGIKFRTDTVILNIAEDLKPVTDFIVDGDLFVRDPENGNLSEIRLLDVSYSADNDEIAQRIWQIYYDETNSGVFDAEKAELISDANETEIIFTTDKVGRYIVRLTAVETFSNTIADLITEDDFRRGDTDEKTPETALFTVDNVKPDASVEIGMAKLVDIVFTVGTADDQTVAGVTAKLHEIKQRLESFGFDVRLDIISSTKLTAEDSFAWTEYDHYNYSDPYALSLPKHIVSQGKNIKMTGYGSVPYKDFIFVENNDNSRKIFNFDIQRDGTDWHSMEGGGFLFNTSIKNNTIQGFCVLITQSGLQLIQISGVNLTSFRNGSYPSLQSAGRLLQTYSIGDVYGSHHIEIVVDDRLISLRNNNTLVINKYQLPQNNYGYGFGPIISHASHSCSQQSYFTFGNITMESKSGEKLSTILENYEWRSNTSRYLINLDIPNLVFGVDDKFDSETEYAAAIRQILQKEIEFIGIGTSDNEKQYTDIIRSAAGSGIYLDYTNPPLAMETLEDYIVSAENAKNFDVDKFVPKDQEIRYINAYSDYENDPLYEQLWEYEYDPTIYYNEEQKTEIQNFTSGKPVTKFEEAGAYTIRLKVRDNPVGGNDALDEFRLWSDTAVFNEVLMVYNRPVAQLSASVSPDAQNPGDCIIEISDDCYSLDHSGRDDFGIASKDYKWKRLYDDQWTEGLIPETVAAGDIYLVSLTVTNIDNHVSYPSVIVISTKNL